MQVSENAGFSAVIVNEPSVAGTTTTVTLPGDGDYWWRVRAKAGADDGPWSEIWQFAVVLSECATPGVPVLSSPPDASETDNLRPTFTWSASADATEYEIAIGENPGLPDAIMVGNPTAPEFTFDDPLQVNQTYYWMVRAHNKAGDCDLSSAWSAPWTVTITEEVVPGMRFAFLPLITNIPYVPPADPLQNGDFEQGAVAWTEFSSLGAPLILHLDDEEDMMTHGGSWAAWLGGLDGESSELTQEVTVPPGQPYLAYYYLLNSADGCGFDFAGVSIDGVEVKSYDVCQATSMVTFGRNVIDLSSYAGETVVLGFTMVTDSGLVSSFFVDDVSFVSSAASAEAPTGSAPTAALPVLRK